VDDGPCDPLHLPKGSFIVSANLISDIFELNVVIVGRTRVHLVSLQIRAPVFVLLLA
jgi:hypothetical protein